MKLGQEFLDKLLEIGEQKFVSTTDLVRKLTKNHIDLNVFSQFYSCIARVNPRIYYNENK